MLATEQGKGDSPFADPAYADTTGQSPSPAPGEGKDDSSLADPGKGDTTDQAPSQGTAVSFVIYHDPDAGAGEVNRYNQAVALLTAAGISYREVTGDVSADAARLAGVSNSVMPRFFFGDPTASDWTSQLKVNNGGLRWLKTKVAELSGSQN